MFRTLTFLSTTGTLAAALVAPAGAVSAPPSVATTSGKLEIAAEDAGFVIKASSPQEARPAAPEIVPLGRSTHLDRALLDRNPMRREQQHADR